MKVIFTEIDVYRIYNDFILGDALTDVIPSVIKIANEYENREDDRTLVVVLNCPCCHDNSSLSLPDKVVFVSPIYGVNYWDAHKVCSSKAQKVYSADKLPPRRFVPKEQREWSAYSLDEYLASFRSAISSALL